MKIHFAGTETEVETFTLEEVLASIRTSNKLILWNDEVNTFHHVIDCLMKYLDYSGNQAEIITETVHYKGKCAILDGSFTEVDVYRKLLQQQGLTLTIE